MSLRSSVRTVFFWTHLSIGISAGLLILLMSVTGVMLGFERQMIARIDGTPVVAETTAEILPLDALLARVNLEREAVATIVLKRDPTKPTVIRMRDRAVAPIVVDPFRAEVLRASGNGSAQAFFSALRRWHRWVGAQGQALRAQMKVVTGVANLIFLALVLSGIYLWWPRRWTPARLIATLVPQWRHRAGHVRDFNWHNSLGFWFALPLVLIIASGAFISFRWPGQYLDLALGNAKEKESAREAMKAPPSLSAGTSATASSSQTEPLARDTPVRDADLDRYVVAAAALRPEWSQLTLTLPDAQATAVRVVVAGGNTYRPDLRWTVELQREQASISSISGYDDLSSARKIRAWVRFGHTGEVFGIAGQILATLTSAVGVLLVWTGFALARRRLVQLLRGRRSAPAVATLPDPSFESPASLR